MNEAILKLIEVKTVTGLSVSSIYRGAAKGSFPKPIKLSVRSSGWLKSEVDTWLQGRIEASRKSVED